MLAVIENLSDLGSAALVAAVAIFALRVLNDWRAVSRAPNGVTHEALRELVATLREVRQWLQDTRSGRGSARR